MPADKYVNGDGIIFLREYELPLTEADGRRFRFSDPEVQSRVGALSDGAISTPTASGSLAGVLRGLWADLRDRIPGFQPVYGNPANLAVTSTLSTGTFITVDRYEKFRIQVKNVGANPLNAFEISTRSHASADMVIHLNAAAHFTSPASGSILRAASDLNGAAINPVTLGAGASIVMAFDFRDFFAESLRIRASSASGTSLQFFWGAS
jgi:hypothetical protein